MPDTSGTKRTRIAPEDVDRLVEWLEEGRRSRWIAGQLGISQSAVYYHRLKAGIAPKPDNGGPAINKRGNRRFTPEEDAILTRMRMDGETLKSISIRLRRGHSSIFMRLQILGVRQD